MKKFITLLLAVVMTSALCFVGCKKPAASAPAPESVSITNSSYTLARNENTLTAAVLPEGASQEVTWSFVGTVPAGITLEDNVAVVSKNTANGATVRIKVAAKTDPTVSETKTFTVNNPPDAPKQISSEADLLAMKDDLTANYELTQDITLTQVWKPLGKADVTDDKDVVLEEGVGFTGTLNGNGYSIKGLNIAAYQNEDKSWVDGWSIGFFYKIDPTGVVENIGFEGKEKDAIYAVGWSGVIAGVNNGTVRNCYTNAGVWMENAPGAALLGTNNGTVENSYAIGNVTISRDLGEGVPENKNTSGLVNSNNGKIIESYVLDTSVMAAVGWENYQDEDIQKSRTWLRTAQNFKDAGWDEDIWYLADGSFPQLRHEGFVAPAPSIRITNTEPSIDCKSEDNSLQITYQIDNLANEEVEFSLKQPVPAGVTITEEGLIETTTEVVHNSTFTVIVTSKANPDLKAEKTIKLINVDESVYIEITTEEELRAIGDDLASNYRLMSNIELTAPWIPLGSPDNEDEHIIGEAFTGKFDGNGFVISNFNVTNNFNYNMGFICKIGAGAIVENLGLESGTDYEEGFWGSAWNGVLAGANNGIVRNCYTNVHVIATGAPGANFIGNNTGTIENCYAIGSASAEGKDNTKGTGFVNGNGGTITNSFVLESSVDATFGNGLTNDGNISKSEADMKSKNLYKDAGWSEAIWTLSDDGYPTLIEGCTKAPVSVPDAD